ncbi:cytochrome P450 [Umbelopsis sp. PMI_123]|nr:cytochrome P450 [Umbelopsis sp. PMI_123]
MSFTADTIKRLFEQPLTAQQYVAITSGTIATGLAILAILYPDKAAFDNDDRIFARRKGYPILGNLPHLLQNVDHVHDFMLLNFETFGRTLSGSVFGMPKAIETVDPANVEHFLKNNFENYSKPPRMYDAMDDLFGHGIFNADGDVWKYQRKTAAHIFNVKNFRDLFTDVFVEKFKYMQSHQLNTAVDSGLPLDFHDLMFKYTLEAFVKLGFGEDLGALRSDAKLPFAAAFDQAQLKTSRRLMLPFWRAREYASRIFTPWETPMSHHIQIVNDYATSIVQKRRAEVEAGVEKHDLLGRFLGTLDENGQPLSEKQLRDIILNFIIAGRDTTAQALSWGMNAIMRHPEVEKKLVEEINANITDEVENDPTQFYEVVKNMKYTHATFYEILRLYPPVPANSKYALGDDIWPDGTVIRKGDYINWSPYAQGRLESVWGPDAKEFKPERWIVNGELKRESQGVWPVFHAGPRVCLGQNLATLESIVVLSLMLKNYKFKLVPDQTITYQVSITMPMKYGMKVYVEKR